MKKQEDNIQINEIKNKKKSNKKNKSNSLYKGIFIKISNGLLFILLLIYIYYYFLFPKKVGIPKLRKLNHDYSEISLTFNTESTKKIINAQVSPNVIYINEVDMTSSKDSLEYTFTLGETIIRLIWYNAEFTTCENMFYKFSHMIKADLSKFDSSNVVTTNQMFFQCGNLKEINLANFDTSSIINMANMFTGCNSFTSIDVSSFNTSKVENMYNLFAYNYKLTSVDLSNFDVSKVTDMRHMFYD